jgi:hypothetical protein
VTRRLVSRQRHVVGHSAGAAHSLLTSRRATVWWRHVGLPACSLDQQSQHNLAAGLAGVLEHARLAGRPCKRLACVPLEPPSTSSCNQRQLPHVHKCY